MSYPVALSSALVIQLANSQAGDLFVFKSDDISQDEIKVLRDAVEAVLRNAGKNHRVGIVAIPLDSELTLLKKQDAEAVLRYAINRDSE